VPGLDLTCDLKGALKDFSEETLTCSRSSRRADACKDGVFGSLSLSIYAGAVVVVKPMQCIPVNDPLGYTYSGSGGQSYIFERSP
jgi:hypothetical protein